MKNSFKANNLRVGIHTSNYGRSPVGYGGGNSAFVKGNAKKFNIRKTEGSRIKRKSWTMNIGAWNIQGLATKTQEVFAEIGEMGMDIITLTETKKKGTNRGNRTILTYVE